jgi:hypothetical protein
MTRAELVQRLVLDTTCDDFENLDQVILRSVADSGTKCGLTVHRGDVVDALKVLVANGLAKAYNLSATRDPFASEIDGMPPLDTVEEDFRTYFLITEVGLKFHQTDEVGWPPDENGELRSDWNPREPV